MIKQYIPLLLLVFQKRSVEEVGATIYDTFLKFWSHKYSVGRLFLCMHRPPIVKINVKLLLKFLKISTQHSGPEVDKTPQNQLLFQLFNDYILKPHCCTTSKHVLFLVWDNLSILFMFFDKNVYKKSSKISGKIEN